MSNLIKENRNFINKFKSLLEAEIRTNSNSQVEKSLNVYTNINVFGSVAKVLMGIYMIPDKEVYVVEYSKKIYFCLKFKEKSRFFIKEDLDQNDDDILAERGFVEDVLDRYGLDKSYVEDIKKYLISKGITSVGNRSVSNINDQWDLYYEMKSNSDLLRGYKDLEEYKKVIKDLKSAKIEVKRHSDVYKAVKDDELIPIAYIDGNELVYPSTWANSRRSTRFLNRIALNAILSGTSRYSLKDLTTRSIDYLPYRYYLVVNVKGSIVDEAKTYRYNNN